MKTLASNSFVFLNHVVLLMVCTMLIPESSSFEVQQGREPSCGDYSG